MAKVDEFEFFLQKEWSDGLPVVTPTAERLQRMLAGTKLDPGKIIGYIAPAGERASGFQADSCSICAAMTAVGVAWWAWHTEGDLR